MRALLQRVSQAQVPVDDRVAGRIGRGLVVLLGVTHSDGTAEADWLARKVAGLRVFEDSDGKMNAALADVDGRAAGCFAVHPVRRCAQGTTAVLYRRRTS